MFEDQPRLMSAGTFNSKLGREFNIDVLRRIQIYNPFASQLGFATSQTRFRRDHEKYLTLIHTITLLHQNQREIHTTEVDGQAIEYLEVTQQDIVQANALAAWALGRSIDELPEPMRRLLQELFDWVQSEAKRQGVSPSEYTFTRGEAREALRWNATHLRNHLEQLVQAEYVVPHRGRSGQARVLLKIESDRASRLSTRDASLQRRSTGESGNGEILHRKNRNKSRAQC